MNAVTIQVQIDKESGAPTDLPVFTRGDLQQISLAVDALAKLLGDLRLGYVRAQVYLNKKALNLSDFI